MSGRRRLSGRYRVERADGADALLLRVDVDGPTPLEVLSLAPASDDGSGGWALLARIESRTRERETLELRARVWPQLAGEPFADVVSLRVVLERARGSEPHATLELSFADGSRHGPWRGPRVSPAFRSVALQIDHEPGARALPIIHTHAHPDRPARLRAREVGLSDAYADAGVELLDEPASAAVPNSSAGQGHPWTVADLHDSMSLHWRAYSTQRQWKLWLLMARQFERSRVAGLMFDTDPDAHEGASRRGVAIFTHCAYFHDPSGVNAQANPPAEPAARRELLFNLVHELGHAFNLPHPFERKLARWRGPEWFEPSVQPGALTWMSYPNDADPRRREGAPWFYRRFGFRFRRCELLFLRHAPERCVVMAGASWLQDHARTTVDEPRLRVALRRLRATRELGEPVLVELHLRNHSNEPVWIHANIDASEGQLEITVRGPDDRARPWLPLVLTRSLAQPLSLAPGATLAGTIDLSVDRRGPVFTRPGVYRIELCVQHPGGRVSRASTCLRVTRPGPREAALVRELLEPRVARVMHCGGSRVDGEVLAKLRWVRDRLGPGHPITLHLGLILHASLARPAQVFDPRQGLLQFAADPEQAAQELTASRAALELAVRSLGPVRLRELEAASVALVNPRRGW